MASTKKRRRPAGSTDLDVDRRAWHVLVHHITGDSVLAAARNIANLRGVITDLTRVSVSAARKAYQRRREAWGSGVIASRESGILVTATLDPTYTPPQPPPACRCDADPFPHLHCFQCERIYPPLLTSCQRQRCGSQLTGAR
jgi:hypothetical protein